MTSSEDAVLAAGPDTAAAAPASPRPFLWSLRRELWENRSITLAPLIAAGVVLFGFVMSKLHPPHVTITTSAGRAVRTIPADTAYDIAAVVIILTGIVVSLFYCAGALYGERRDRSVLFWKSLPVSDLTTVLAKAVVPILVIPVVAIVVATGLQVIMLAIDTVVSLAKGSDPAIVWAQIGLWPGVLVLVYGVLTTALWQAPVFGWLIMVSAWARRTPLLWAAGPPLALCVIERLSFGTSVLWRLLTNRFGGGLGEAFILHRGPVHRDISLADLTPLKYLASPGLWIGLVLFAACLAAAVWLRRRKEPV